MNFFCRQTYISLHHPCKVLESKDILYALWKKKTQNLSFQHCIFRSHFGYSFCLILHRVHKMSYPEHAQPVTLPTPVMNFIGKPYHHRIATLCHPMLVSGPVFMGSWPHRNQQVCMAWPKHWTYVFKCARKGLQVGHAGTLIWSCGPVGHG